MWPNGQASSIDEIFVLQDEQNFSFAFLEKKSDLKSNQKSSATFIKCIFDLSVTSFPQFKIMNGKIFQEWMVNSRKDCILIFEVFNWSFRTRSKAFDWFRFTPKTTWMVAIRIHIIDPFPGSKGCSIHSQAGQDQGLLKKKYSYVQKNNYYSITSKKPNFADLIRWKTNTGCNNELWSSCFSVITTLCFKIITWNFV